LYLTNPLCLQIQDLYPKASIDVEVSSGEDNAPKPDALTDKEKAPIGDDAEDGGASSAEPITPNPIGSNAPEQTDPFITDWVTTIVPPAGGHRCKHPPLVIKRKQPLPSLDQVMSQIELPPYYGPLSPLDLVAIVIIFGRLFEAFRHTSQVVDVGDVTDGNDRLPNKTRQPSLRKLLVPR
jgi:hypothetical protein